MIYTLTLNPAVDYVVHIHELCKGQIIRSEQENVFYGGKGINVSIALDVLGVKSAATGFLAGFTGLAIENELKKRHIDCDFVFIEDELTRINVKIRSGEETDINAQGPNISQASLALLLKKLNDLKNGDTLVMAGSVPKTLPQSVYSDIVSRLQSRGIRLVADISGKQLLEIVKYSPFLIKPNFEELREMFPGRQLSDSPEDVIKCARELKELGAVNVLISLGSGGAVLADETGAEHFMPAFRGNAVNTVGAGDAMVAGFIAGYDRTKDYGYALRLGTAAGGATAFCEGIASAKDIYSLFDADNA